MPDLEIVKQRKNPLMKREEYVISLDHAGKPTPSRKELLSQLAKKVKCKEELIIVDSIFTNSGRSISRIRALAYSKVTDIPKGKLEKMKARMEKKEKPKAEGPKPEAEGPKPEAEAKPEEAEKTKTEAAAEAETKPEAAAEKGPEAEKPVEIKEGEAKEAEKKEKTKEKGE